LRCPNYRRVIGDLVRRSNHCTKVLRYINTICNKEFRFTPKLKLDNGRFGKHDSL
jgi:hypothetical protein